MVPSSAVLKSPLTEIILAYFPADASASDRDRKASQLQQILSDGFKESAGVQRVGHGWGSENDFPIRGSDGQTGSILMSFVSWSGIDAQESYSKTDAYAQAMKDIKGLEGSVAVLSFTLASRSLERPGDLA